MLQFSLVCRRAFNRAGWLAFVLAAAFLLAPAQRAEAAKCPAQPYPVPAGFGHSGNLGELKLTLINYGCFGDYQRELAQEIASARAFIETRAGEVARPAIVLDIDETSLSNWRALLADDFGYIVGGPCRIGGTAACGMLAWELSAAAEPIVPMVELVRAAQARGVAVFFLTGRNGDAAQRAATARNLRRAGYARWAELIMRAPPEYRLGNAAYKSARRAQIAAKGYAIIANIGDQDSDLAGGYAERTYKLPNPFYFLP